MRKDTRIARASTGRLWSVTRWVSLAMTVGFLIVSVAACDQVPQIEIQHVYTLAFAESGSDRIRVRYSSDGQTWSDGNFPSHTTSVGVGATSSAEGLLHMVLWTDSSKKVQALWGLGPAVWDSTPGGPALTQNALSAPSAAYAGESLYLVAFRTAGDVVTLRVLDVTSKRWLTVSLAPADNANSSVSDRPVVAVLNGKVLLAWHRVTDDTSTVKIARGNLKIVTVEGQKIPVMDWTDVYTFGLSESGYGPPSVDSNVALTHDGSTFHLGVVRRSTGGGLRHDKLFVYPSADGISWGTPTGVSQIPLYAYVSIAARSDGSLLAALVGPASNPKRALYKFEAGSCTELLLTTSSSGDDVFGWVPGQYREFALISNKP